VRVITPSVAPSGPRYAVVVFRLGQRPIVHHGHRAYARNNLQPLEHLAIKLDLARPRIIFTSRVDLYLCADGNSHREDMICVKPRVGALQSDEAPNQQARTNQKQEREGGFRGDEDGKQPR
jgi:hypothetical protein